MQAATYTYVSTPIGEMRLVRRGSLLWAATFCDWPIARDLKHAVPDAGGFDDVRRQLDAYFVGRSMRFTLPLDLSEATDFRRAVWGALGRIPYGQTRTYADVASAIARPRAARAVGNANRLNRFAIVIPCHRVIGGDGGLRGYAGGVARKEWLLAHERAVLARVGKRALPAGLSPGALITAQ